MYEKNDCVRLRRCFSSYTVIDNSFGKLLFVYSDWTLSTMPLSSSCFDFVLNTKAQWRYNCHRKWQGRLLVQKQRDPINRMSPFVCLFSLIVAFVTFTRTNAEMLIPNTSICSRAFFKRACKKQNWTCVSAEMLRPFDLVPHQCGKNILAEA